MKILLLSILAAVNLIPAPVKYEAAEGSFTLSERTEYVISGKAADLVEYLQVGSPLCPLTLSPAASKAKTAPVAITISKKAKVPEEGYILDVTPKGVSIKAVSRSGAFHAVQTLYQLYNDAAADGAAQIACCHIYDKPSYGHRGLMFDVSRHFRTPEFVCKQLDAMAYLKMSRMHFHLDDAVGWRLQLDSHPELTKECSFRKEVEYTSPFNLLPEPADYVPGEVYNKPGYYGGYYTKDQIRQILEYARLRNIEIIPEIEMPGHSAELFDVHRELFCDGPDVKKTSSICPGKDATYKFFEEILTETMELFPSKYIHIGGDEASKRYWKTCPDCQKKMKEEGLETVEELQSFFVRHMDKFVASKGKKIIGWDEIMQGGLSEGATVMSWRGPEHGMKAMEMGHDVIMSPTAWCYLDYYQNAPHLEPKAIGGYVPLEKTYSFEMPADKHLLGIQGNLWTEYVIEDSHFEYMLYPRAFALSELGWSPVKSEDFRDRAIAMEKTFTKAGYTVFDLQKEVPSDDAQNVAQKHLAYGCKCTYTGLDPWELTRPNQTEEKMLRRLTDGRERSVTRFTYGATVTVDLGKACDVHAICPVFKTCDTAHPSRIPSEVLYYVSSDGVNFRQAAVRRQTQNDSEIELGTVQFPAFVCEKDVRYVKVGFEPGPFCNFTAIAEVVVN